MRNLICTLTVLWVIAITQGTALATETQSFRLSRTLEHPAHDISIHVQLANTIPTISAKLKYTEALNQPAQKHVARWLTGSFSVHISELALLDDNDLDGFFSSLKLSIDADTHSPSSHAVYIAIYLRLDGGTWNHFYTSDIYTIHGWRSDDILETISVLDTGYPAGYYDILIELYDAEYDVLLADYGPLDTLALSALMLEDGQQDNYYDVASGHRPTGHLSYANHGGGALDEVMLSILWMLAVAAGWRNRR